MIDRRSGLMCITCTSTLTMGKPSQNQDKLSFQLGGSAL